MKVCGCQRRTVPAARPSRVPGARSCTARSVWPLSHSPNREPPCRSGGLALLGICELFFFFFFPFLFH